MIYNYCTPDEVDQICNIIKVHDDRYSKRDILPDYIKIHQDADHLDHFGTFDIWSTFLYSAGNNHTINDCNNFLLNSRPNEDRQYRNELNFDISKRIYDEKADFVKQFAERFNVETNGGIWAIDKII